MGRVGDVDRIENDSDVEMLGGVVGERYTRIVGQDRPESCPKCGHDSAGINLDNLTEEWTCLLCGWHSGSRSPVPVIPELGWPHQRLWTHKE